MTDQLKPCPFCGAAGDVESRDFNDWNPCEMSSWGFFPTCTKDDCILWRPISDVYEQDAFDTYEQAAAAWNRRHNPEAEALPADVPQWISVDEQLPEAGVTVLSFDEEGQCNIDKILSDDIWESRNGLYCFFFDHKGYEAPRITHWLPLPTAPETGGKR